MKKNLLFICVLSLFSSACFLSKVANTQKSYTIFPREEDDDEGGISKFDRMDLAMEQEIEKTKDERGYVPKEKLLEALAYAEKLRKSTDRVAIPNIIWEERGPNNVGGRTRSILVDKNDASNKTVFVGSVGGGLWKTTDITAAAPNWTKINDFFDNIAVTTIAQDPNIPSKMYFGTGEGWYNSDRINGLGLWQSTDGGATWANMAGTSAFGNIQKVVVDQDGNVFAATSSSGIQRYNGTAWATALTQASPSNEASDLEIGADGDIYASFGIFAQGKVFKSDRATYGTSTGAVAANWLNISPSGAYRRVEIACAPSDASKLYIVTQNTASAAGSIFQGTGAAGNVAPTWTDRGTPQTCDQTALVEFTRGQAWYDLIGAVDPNEANTLYVGGIDVMKTTDGGATWNQITVWSSYTNSGSSACGFSSSPKPVVHSDHHAMTFIPGSSATMLLGNDGGIYYGTNLNTTSPAFTAKNTDYNVTQYYACAVHPTASTDYFLAGAQDNGTNRLTSVGIASSTNVSGGDGAFCHIDQDNANTQISSYVYNNYYVTTNNWGGSTSYSNGSTGQFINPTDYDNATNLLYAGYNAGLFTRMTTAGVFTNVTVTAFGTGKVTHVMVSPNTSDVVYFGLNNGTVVKVTGASTASGTVAGTLVFTHPAGSKSISCVAIEDNAGTTDDHILVTASNYSTVSVYETTNGTVASPTWTSVEGNLPNMPVRWAMFAPNNNDHALLATEVGVWTTDNLNGGTTDWQPSNTGLANVRTDMLQYRASDGLILAATHGRGLFSTYKYAPFNKLSYVTASSANTETGATSGTTCPKYKEINIPVTITKPPVANVTVNITVNASSTATNGSDYTLQTPTLTFTPSGGISQNIVVRIYNDATIENNETLILDIASTSPDITGTNITQHTLTISSEDTPPTYVYAGLASIGTGTGTSTSTPFKGSTTDHKMQLLYTVAELNTAGLVANHILSSLAFNIATKASTQAFNGFTIKMGHTAVADLSAGIASPISAFTTTYSNNYTTTTGWNTFPFTSNFVWNGTNNILIEICFDNSTTSGDDAVYLTSTAPTIFQRRASAASLGCSISSLGTTSTSKANIRIGYGAPAVIQTAVNPGVSERYLGPNQTVHFYDDSGKIMATIQNTSAHDFGCTKVEVDRAGTGATAFWNTNTANKAMDKTFKVTPTNNNVNAPYTITLYYTQAEVNGWLTATGNSISNVKIVKIAGYAISDVTPTTQHVSDVTIASTTSNALFNAVNYTFTASLTGFSGFGASSPGPLPIDLSDFSGYWQDHKANLSWTTQSERQNEGFEIERAIDGKNYTKIGFVKGENQPYTYSFEDSDVYGETQYYRLKQVDINGAFSYSNIVTLKTDYEESVQLSPNPLTGNRFQLKFGHKIMGNVDWKFVNENGQIIYNRSLENVDATQIDIEITDFHLASGVYFVHVIWADGGKREIIKVIVP